MVGKIACNAKHYTASQKVLCVPQQTKRAAPTMLEVARVELAVLPLYVATIFQGATMSPWSIVPRYLVKAKENSA